MRAALERKNKRLTRIAKKAWATRSANAAKMNRQKLFDLAKKGGDKVLLGQVLGRYVRKSSSACDTTLDRKMSNLDRKIRKIAPDWFIISPQKKAWITRRANEKAKKLSAAAKKAWVTRRQAA